MVVQVGGDSPIDRFVTIHHEPFDLGIVTSYRHMHDPTVTKGQSVASGKKIGQVGPGSPSHLHFELRQVFNQSLLDEYLLIYKAGPTLPDNITLPADPNTNPISRYVLTGVRSNIGNTGHSLPLDPTRSLYNWEKNGFKNDSATRHISPRGKLAVFNEVVRDRMLRFVRVQVAGNAEEIFLPLVKPTPDEISLLETLRKAFFLQMEIQIVWRESLFYADVQPPLMKLLVEVMVHP